MGFLGAGLIFRESSAGQVHGPTTALSSWAAAAMGILAGAGDYLAAALGTVLVLLLLEANRLPLYRRPTPNKRRVTGSGERFGTTEWPTAPRPAPEAGEEPEPGEN